MGLGNLKIGTKLTIGIAILVLICMLGLMFIIITQVNKEQLNTTHKLLSAVSDESAEIISNNINSSYMSLASVTQRLEQILHNGGDNGNQDRLEIQTKTMLDGNLSGTYAYIYINDSSFIGDNIANPRNKLENGEFMLLARDTKPDEIGGVEMLQADMTILNFGSVKQALQTGKPSIGNPTFQDIAKQGKKFGFAVNVPLKNKRGEVKGVAGIFIDLDVTSKSILDQKLSVFNQDYRVVLSDNTTVAIHPRHDMLGKPFRDINTDKSAISVSKAAQDKRSGVYEYINYQGKNMIARLKTFEVGINTGVFWSILVVAPGDSVYESLYNLQIIIIASICVSLIVIICYIFFYIKFAIISRINNLKNYLLNFFQYLAHESPCPTIISPRANDELGAMVATINAKIETTQYNTEKDSALVNEAFEVINHTCGGHATRRITLNGANPRPKRFSQSTPRLTL